VVAAADSVKRVYVQDAEGGSITASIDRYMGLYRDVYI